MRLHACITGAALLQFISGIRDPYQSLLLWSNESHPCGDEGSRLGPWPGITCDAVSGSVVGIDLSSRGLSGQLSPSLADLDTLTSM